MAGRKSHMAIECCYKFREQHSESVVIWVASGSSPRVEQSLVEVSRKLSVPSFTNNPLQNLLKWLDGSSQPDWLLVFDDFVPGSLDESAFTLWTDNQSPERRGSILLTTESLY